MGKKTQKIKWLNAPEEHDYPAAQEYLSLVFDDDDAKRLIWQLKESKIVWYKAKDVFRASKLSLLGVSNSHVKRNCKKIKNGDKMSPILLVIDSEFRNTIIADGYHRMCGVYHYDEDALIPCKKALVY